MSKKVFVGNLDFKTNAEKLNEIFSDFGDIEDSVVISDRDTGRSKGFGFVTFAEDSDAEKAISAMNGKETNGRKLTVNIAEEKEDKPRRSFSRDRSEDHEDSDDESSRYYTTKKF